MTFEQFINEGKLPLDKLVAMINQKYGPKPDCAEVAMFVYDNYNKVTGLNKSARNDEGYFPNEVEALVDEFGFDIDEFSDCYGRVAESISSGVHEKMISPKDAKGLWTGDVIKTQNGTYTITGFGNKTNATRDFEAENEKGEKFMLRVSLRGATGIQVAAGANNLNFPEKEEMLESVDVSEAWVGPFQFNDKMSDDELKKMYDEALSGYANWQKGFEYPKSDYKKAYQEIEKILKKKGVVVESAINEAKAVDRDEMIDWIQQHMKFVKTTEEFDGSKGGIWVSGENMDLFKGKRIYDYYNETKAYDLGVLNSWEKELNKRGWYSEWYDAGTVMIWQD